MRRKNDAIIATFFDSLPSLVLVSFRVVGVVLFITYVDFSFNFTHLFVYGFLFFCCQFCYHLKSTIGENELVPAKEWMNEWVCSQHVHDVRKFSTHIIENTTRSHSNEICVYVIMLYIYLCLLAFMCLTYHRLSMFFFHTIFAYRIVMALCSKWSGSNGDETNWVELYSAISYACPVHLYTPPNCQTYTSIRNWHTQNIDTSYF